MSGHLEFFRRSCSSCYGVNLCRCTKTNCNLEPPATTFWEAYESMVVSGSPKRWDRWHIIPQLAVYTTYIPLIVLAEPGGWKMLPIPPFRGTRNNHWMNQALFPSRNSNSPTSFFNGWRETVISNHQFFMVRSPWKRSRRVNAPENWCRLPFGISAPFSGANIAGFVSGTT